MPKKLNDTQRAIIAAAAAREDLRVLPIPETVTADEKVLTQMIKAGLIAEATALPDDPAWIESAAGGRVTLVATPAGLAAIGIEGETSPTEPHGAARGALGAPSHRKRGKAAARASVGEGGGKQSKQNIVLAMLRRPEGASVPEMVSATGWQPHSVRGFMSGALKKRLGLEVTTTKGEDGERRYHVGVAKAEDTEA